ncbi:MAG: carboxypeptidase regulatory-like domain-containing protein, partial [Deltaproteobacteria bacterium]|nr:carboxypeptidase regulatory-like domain-containing protein [Deltaproteobacteria bacterium]
MRRVFVIALFSLIPGLVACGSDDEDKSCTPVSNAGCEDGLICELVLDGEPACFARFEVQGRVFDGLDDTAIAGATVVGLDANGGARTTTVITGSDGSYSLPVSAQRDKEGNPLMDEQITLRVAASEYQAFPKAPRLALPIDLKGFVEQEKSWVVANATTDVALFPLEGDTSALVTIEGHVDADNAGGVLVVAVQGAKAVSSTVTGNGGGFVLFNVPAGETSVEGYRQGLAIDPASVTVGNETVKDVVLVGSTAGLATVTGSVNIVNAPGGSLTSVLLVLESTFDALQKRGESPAGLRAGDVASDFSIENVPPGDYVVLAAFENDDLVRDPDESIGG